MKIVWYIVAVLLLVLVAYIADLILTAGKLIDNLLYAFGISGEKLVDPVDAAVITAIYFAVTTVVIATIVHLAKSIRKREV